MNPTKLSFCVVATFGACSVSMRVQSQTVPAPSAPTPVPQALFDAISNNPGEQLFSNVLKVSGLSRKDIHEAYLTAVVPRDATCSGSDRATLERQNDPATAKAYVLEHAFPGQIAIYREGVKLVRVTYFPDSNEMRGKIVIDENHPFAIPLLSGKSVLVSVRGSEIVMGQEAVLMGSYGAEGGAVVELDHCAELLSSGRTDVSGYGS